MKRHYWLLYLLAIVKLTLPFLLQDAIYEPHRDEFLYLAEGKHMAWGFMEVPPLLSVFAWLVNLAGGSMFWIKWWPSLFGALTFLLVGKTILSLGGKSFALLLGFLPFVTGVYLRIHFLFQPNFLEIFFWTLMAFSLVCFVQTRNNYWLYSFGMAIGLGMMSKYSVIFFTASLLAGLLLTRQRTIFLNKHLYFAGLLALLIVLPNLAWQYNHHFPVVYHMKELSDTQLQYVSPAGFLTDQLLMNLPCVVTWLAGLAWLLIARQAAGYRFVGIAYLTVLLLLLVGHGKNYYALGAYPILFAFGAWWLEKATAVKFRVTRYALVLLALVLGGLLLPLALPLAAPRKLEQYYQQRNIDKTGMLKWEDLQNHPLPQDFADMLGWKEMATKMAAAYQQLNPAEKAKTMLFCDNYGQAGAVNYYGNTLGLPPVHSTNASFLYWMPATPQFDNLVLLTDDTHEMEHDFIKNFTSATLFDSVSNSYAREKGSLIIILKGADEHFKEFFRKKMADEKAKVKW
ncbi:MAG TPA: glycosyltransferase family 39 protein [Chitinophagaceae bacterium]|nr:glycosyltransferase family 39 protein [Chitinophagaceae bacterium]